MIHLAVVMRSGYDLHSLDTHLSASLVQMGISCLLGENIMAHLQMFCILEARISLTMGKAT